MPSETDGTSNMWSQGLSQTSHLIFIDLPNLFHLGKIVRVNKLLCRGNQGRNSWIDGEGLWITEDHQEAWLSTDGWGSVWMAFHIFLPAVLYQWISTTCNSVFYSIVLNCFLQSRPIQRGMRNPAVTVAQLCLVGVLDECIVLRCYNEIWDSHGGWVFYTGFSILDWYPKKM